MRRLLIALTGLLLLAAIGLLVLAMLPYLNRASHPAATVENREIVCLGGPKLNGKQQVQFFHPTKKVPEATWMSPAVGIATAATIPNPSPAMALRQPSRSLNIAAGLGDGDPTDDCAMLFDAFEMFKRTYGENPVGNQEQILQALCGTNPKNIAFLSRDTVKEGWKIPDRWGTPFFFHQLSGTVTEVVSAGPDKQFGTDDDIQIPEATSSF